jgi:hypothetical protein
MVVRAPERLVRVGVALAVVAVAVVYAGLELAELSSR